MMEGNQHDSIYFFKRENESSVGILATTSEVRCKTAKRNCSRQKRDIKQPLHGQSGKRHTNKQNHRQIMGWQRQTSHPSDFWTPLQLPKGSKPILRREQFVVHVMQGLAPFLWGVVKFAPAILQDRLELFWFRPKLIPLWPPGFC